MSRPLSRSRKEENSWSAKGEKKAGNLSSPRWKRPLPAEKNQSKEGHPFHSSKKEVSAYRERAMKRKEAAESRGPYAPPSDVKKGGNERMGACSFIFILRGKKLRKGKRKKEGKRRRAMCDT